MQRINSMLRSVFFISIITSISCFGGETVTQTPRYPHIDILDVGWKQGKIDRYTGKSIQFNEKVPNKPFAHVSAEAPIVSICSQDDGSTTRIFTGLANGIVKMIKSDGVETLFEQSTVSYPLRLFSENRAKKITNICSNSHNILVNFFQSTLLKPINSIEKDPNSLTTEQSTFSSLKLNRIWADLTNDYVCINYGDYIEVRSININRMPSFYTKTFANPNKAVILKALGNKVYGGGPNKVVSWDIIAHMPSNSWNINENNNQSIVKSMAFNPININQLVVGTKDGQLFSIDCREENAHSSYFNNSDLNTQKLIDIKFARNGNFLFSAMKNTIKIFDIRSNSAPLYELTYFKDNQLKINAIDIISGQNYNTEDLLVMGTTPVENSLHSAQLYAYCVQYLIQ